MFKKCTMCEKSWETLDDFVKDKEIKLNGYQVNIIDPLRGMFIFTHNIPLCGTSVAIKIDKLASLSEKPLPTQSIERPHDCPGHCLIESNFNKCTATFCLGQVIRDLLQTLANIPKEIV
jgi:hypothetical protein